MIFLKIVYDHVGCRLLETENKRICQISDLKSGCGCLLRNLSMREFSEQYLTEKQNVYFQSGLLQEVVAMRELRP